MYCNYSYQWSFLTGGWWIGFFAQIIEFSSLKTRLGAFVWFVSFFASSYCFLLALYCSYSCLQYETWQNTYIGLSCQFSVRERAPGPFYRMLGQTHVNGWSHVIASQNGASIDYISPLRLRVLQWRCHLFNYWKNKKTIIEKFLILLI